MNQWSPWGAPLSGEATEGVLCLERILWVEKSVLCSKLDPQVPLQPCWTNFLSGWCHHWSLKIVIPGNCQSKMIQINSDQFSSSSIDFNRLLFSHLDLISKKCSSNQIETVNLYYNRLFLFLQPFLKTKIGKNIFLCTLV